MPIYSAFSLLAKPEDIFIFTVENNEQINEAEKVVEVEVDSMADQSTSASKGKSKGSSSKTKKVGKWNLQKSGRFAHSEEYLKELESSFPNLKMISLTKIVPR
jgi:hypothetical protein